MNEIYSFTTETDMKLKTALLSASLALFTFNLSADTVDKAEVIDFQAGAPACAADVNQTIQALITAVDDNATRVETLETQVTSLNTQVSTLQSQLAALGTPPTLLSILNDSKFTVYSHEVGVGASSNADGHGILNSFVFGETAIYTLHAGGLLNISYNYAERGTGLRVSSHLDFDPVFLDTDINDVGSGSFNGTWSLSGSRLTVSYDGDTDVFLVTSDGNMILSGGAEIDDVALTPTGSLLTNSEVVIGIRAVAAP